MKLKFKRYYKRWLLLLSISMLCSNCEKEELSPLSSPTNTQTKTVNFQMITSNKLDKSPAINTVLKTIDSNFDSHQKEIIISDNNDFTIDTEQALMHIDGSHKTYTFMVYRDPTNSDVLENLLIDIDTLNNTTRQLLVSYPRLGDSYDFQYTEITEIK